MNRRDRKSLKFRGRSHSFNTLRNFFRIFDSTEHGESLKFEALAEEANTFKFFFIIPHEKVSGEHLVFLHFSFQFKQNKAFDEVLSYESS